jgi:mono/diheme cytochrome c family protein
VKWRWALASTVVTVVALLAGATWFMRRGFSARDEPSTLERVIARTARSMAVPNEAKRIANPVVPSPEVLAEARAHFADHCATCHANDGSGKTPIGQGLYPKPPDMRLPATQNMTDGELYYTIHNGIRLTGMPAFGRSAGDVDSWKLVHFVRHLPELTDEELQEMQTLNQQTPDELEEEREEREFLAGSGDTKIDEHDSAGTKAPTHTIHHH